MSGRSSRDTGINILRPDDSFFIIVMYLRLIRYYEMRSHLYPFCSQHKCCRNSSSVCDPSCRNDRNLNCICNLRYQYHRCILSDVSSRFTAFCHQSICSAAFHTFCKGHRSNHRNDFYSCFFPHLHVFLRISRTGRNDFYAFFHDDFRHLIRIRAHQHNIDSKWFICQFLCFAYLFSHPLGRCTCSSDQTESSCF